MVVPAGIPAAAYYRMSTDRQETSIPDQRAAVRAYAAKHGYAIVREYVDEGISGDATEKRKAFQQMLTDAEALGDFQVVLCWDQDRFGRFDPLEAGYWVKPLRDRGIYLETVAQGRINWNDFAGRIVYAVQQEGKHAFLLDLSRNATRGMLARAKAGVWLGGFAPYGYELRDGRLVPGDPAEVETVRWIFATYARGGSLWGLVEELNRRGIPAPGGGLWHKTGVHKILKRPLYRGDMVWNRQHKGKYHEVRDGNILATGGRRRKANLKNAEPDWVVVEGTHEPLVDRETFARVQELLAARRHRTTPRPAGGDFLLTGLLFCMECGSPMHGCTNVKRRGGSASVYRRYICGRYNLSGRAGCKCNTLAERQLAHAVRARVQADFLNPANLEALHVEIRRQLREDAPPAEPPPRLKARIAELGRQIDQGNANLALLPPDRIPGVVAKVREWEAERDRLAAALPRRKGGSPAGLEAKVEAAVAELWTLQEMMGSADPGTLREVFHQSVARVECWFDHVPYGRREKSRLRRGLIRVREDLAVSRLVPPAPPVSTMP